MYESRVLRVMLQESMDGRAGRRGLPIQALDPAVNHLLRKM